MSNYIPHSLEETKEMLKVVGVNSIDDLYEGQCKDCAMPDIGEGKTQAQVEHFFNKLGAQNKVFKNHFARGRRL